jgi:flagellar basal body-associated protein FliL
MSQKKPTPRRVFSLVVLIILLIVISVVVISILPNSHVESFNVPAGYVETETVNLNNGWKFTGSVAISGGSGNDVNFWITNPQGATILNDGRVSQGTTFEFTAQQSGAYVMHFDNTFSIVSTKMVNLSWSVHPAIFGIDLGFLLTVIAIVIAIAFVVLFLLTLLAFVLFRRKQRRGANQIRYHQQSKPCHRKGPS